MLLPNLGTLALSPGNVLVRCPECASLFQKASPTGCAECGGTRKRKEEEEKKECGCDDDDVPDPNDPNISEQWKNAWMQANGYSTGRRDVPEAPAACECEEKEEEEEECACDDSPKPEFRSSLGEESEDKDEAPSSSD